LARARLTPHGGATARALDFDQMLQALTRFEALCDAMPLAVAVFGATLTLEYANARFRDIAGLREGEVRTLSQVLSGATGDVASLLEAAAARRAAHGVRLRVSRLDGERAVEMSLEPLGDPAHPRRPIAVFVADITEQQRLSLQLEQQVHRSAMLSQKMSMDVEQLEHQLAKRTGELESTRLAAERARQALEERKTIERAKGVLMRRQAVTEEQAYHQMRRASQDRARAMVEVARAILEDDEDAGA
jgi:two-component system, response regulator / RNA-binding antiterminator